MAVDPLSERGRYVRNVFARPKRSVTASVYVSAAQAVPARVSPDSSNHIEKGSGRS